MDRTSLKRNSTRTCQDACCQPVPKPKRRRKTLAVTGQQRSAECQSSSPELMQAPRARTVPYTPESMALQDEIMCSNAAYRCGAPTVAAELLNACLRQAPKVAALQDLATLAQALEAQGHYRHAGVVFARCLTIAGPQEPYLLGLADVLLHEAHCICAMGLYQHTLRLYPHSAAAYASLAVAYSIVSLHPQADAAFAASLRIAPKNAETHFLQATALIRRGQFGDAMGALSNTLLHAPTHLRAMFALRGLQLHSGQITAADNTAMLLQRVWQQRIFADGVPPAPKELLLPDWPSIDVAQALEDGEAAPTWLLHGVTKPSSALT